MTPLHACCHRVGICNLYLGKRNRGILTVLDVLVCMSASAASVVAPSRATQAFVVVVLSIGLYTVKHKYSGADMQPVLGTKRRSHQVTIIIPMVTIQPRLIQGGVQQTNLVSKTPGKASKPDVIYLARFQLLNTACGKTQNA